MISEEAFCKIIQDTWASTLGVAVDRPETAEFSATGALTVCVRITGAWDGEVRLHCPPQLARSIAATIFQVETLKAGSDEILDALSELIHIIGGNLKALLPQPVTLSLPSLPDSSDWNQTMPQLQTVCQLTLVSEGQPFVVALFGTPPATAIADAPADGEARVPAGSP